ncbi:MAG: ATP-dependent helicase [Propionibacteriaceae bacterium]|nr:ATP-dependent helicase [Propionibacteriaceae bacterium]
MSVEAKILSDLDFEQCEAAQLSAPLAVLAGPGSGKTRAITHRIAYQVATGAYESSAVLALTFTNRAAAEMAQRVSELGMTRVTVRTFHSAALRQIKHFWPKAYGFEVPKLLPDRSGLLREAAKDVGAACSEVELRTLSGELSWVKTNNVALAEYAARAHKAQREVLGMDLEQTSRILGRFEYVKASQGYIDFDDVLLCCCAMLDEKPGIAQQVRQTYRHLLVDEFQDTSPLQFALLRLWLGENQDITVVGDPAQTIHGFAGATARYLLDFEEEFPDAELVRFKSNYRSSPQLVSFANNFAEANEIPAAILTSKTSARTPPEFGEHADAAAEAAAIADWLLTQKASGVAWDELAVLFRVHAQAEVLQEALKAAKIPVWVQNNDDSIRATESRVRLATLHACKGLEWKAVAIAGMQEGMLPYSLVSSSAQLREEARLCYVGITRARHALYLSWVGRRSRFIPETLWCQ